MNRLRLMTISEVGVDRYRVVFADEDENETIVVCEVSDQDGIRGMNPISKNQPSIFMTGEADPRETAKALYEFRDRRRRGQ